MNSVVEECRICMILWYRGFDYQAYGSEDSMSIHETVGRAATRRKVQDLWDVRSGNQTHLNFQTSMGYSSQFNLQILNSGTWNTIGTHRNKAEIDLRKQQFDTSTHFVRH
jgi:hypothetical protein